jgi:DNA-binding MarR family transcriptional regulator
VLGVIEQRGPLTAGALVHATGLSPAAVTGLIDRLERAGVAERRQDPADRRRVLVALGPRAARITEMYVALERGARAVVGDYSEEELAAIARFLRAMNELGVKHVARLEGRPRR